MRSRSVVLKLWFAFTLLILVAMVPLEFALHRLLMDFYSRQVTEPLLYHSQQLAHMLTTDPKMIQSASLIGKMVGGEVVVLDPRGRPIQFPGASALTPPADAADRTLSGQPFTGRGLGSNGMTLIVTGVPIPNRGGAVLLMAPAEPVEHSLELARRYLWMAGAGTLLLGTGLALFVSRQLLRPVIAIKQATREIARGDFSTRIAIHSGDEIGHLATAVNQMTAQLEAYENRRREFLANVAHELRTPLSYMRGYTQALAEGLVTAPRERERYQRVVMEESIRIGRLVDDLMDLAQIEEGQMAFDLRPLDLRLAVDQAATTVRPLAEKKGVTVEIGLPRDLPHPIADGGRIQQVVFNLLDNALHHTPSGGRICITCTADSGWVRVAVRDSGPGIEPELLPLVFERFHKHQSGGRGLGLAIVRSIIRAHGGEVGVESQPGEGATFWFYLPVKT